MASGQTLLSFYPTDNEPPSSNFATLDSRNGHPVLDFDASTDEAAIFTGVFPRNYAGGGLTVTIWWMATSSATSGNVIWQAAIERQDTGTDLDSDSFASAQSSSATACSGTNGAPVTSTVAFTHGAQMDSLEAGEPFRLKINRDADNGSDTMSVDAEILVIEVKET